jgi:hypothetical protein
MQMFLAVLTGHRTDPKNWRKGRSYGISAYGERCGILVATLPHQSEQKGDQKELWV